MVRGRLANNCQGTQGVELDYHMVRTRLGSTGRANPLGERLSQRLQLWTAAPHLPAGGNVLEDLVGHLAKLPRDRLAPCRQRVRSQSSHDGQRSVQAMPDPGRLAPCRKGLRRHVVLPESAERDE